MENTDHELDRQREALLRHGFPSLVGLAEESFSDAVEALRPALKHHASSDQSQKAPFVLVVSGGADGDMAAAEQQVPRLRLADGSAQGVLDPNHGELGLTPYRPIEEVGPPPAPVYALVDVERGEEFCGVPPQDALPAILARGRTPLTIPEGIALALLYPHILEKNACFMLSGSRRGDRRVPALWISDKAPKLVLGRQPSLLARRRQHQDTPCSWSRLTALQCGMRPMGSNTHPRATAPGGPPPRCPGHRSAHRPFRVGRRYPSLGPAMDRHRAAATLLPGRWPSRPELSGAKRCAQLRNTALLRHSA